MEGRHLLLGMVGVMIVVMGLNFFYVDVARNTGADVETINTQTFNRTADIMDTTRGMKNESSFLEDVPILGDIVAIAGNSIRSLQLLTSVPGLFITMLSDLSLYIGLPAWAGPAIIAIFWIVLVFIFLSFMRGFRT